MTDATKKMTELYMRGFRQRIIRRAQKWLDRRQAGKIQPLEPWEREDCSHKPVSIDGLTISERAELLRYDMPMTVDALAKLRAREAKGERVPLSPQFCERHLLNESSFRPHTTRFMNRSSTQWEN